MSGSRVEKNGSRAQAPRVESVGDIQTPEDIREYLNAIKADVTAHAISGEDSARHLSNVGKQISLMKMEYRYGVRPQAA